MNIKQKIGGAMATGALLLSVMAPASFAATTITITDNGALSKNSAGVVNVNKSKVKQKNNTIVATSVTNNTNTGGNKASFNTGGTTSITTGDSTNRTTVSVTGGTNTNSGSICGCVSTTDVTISDNGALSQNGVFVLNYSSSSVKQTNNTVVVTDVTNNTNTGDNSASFNTNGGSSITTGDSTNTTTVTVEGSSNSNSVTPTP